MKINMDTRRELGALLYVAINNSYRKDGDNPPFLTETLAFVRSGQDCSSSFLMLNKLLRDERKLQVGGVFQQSIRENSSTLQRKCKNLDLLNISPQLT